MYENDSINHNLHLIKIHRRMSVSNYRLPTVYIYVDARLKLCVAHIDHNGIINM